jgi:hypothetical protein
MELYHMKSFCPSKEIIIAKKKQSTEWEKIFESFSMDQKLISRIYK